MKKLFAVPTVNGKLTQHFGHCDKFAIIETQDNSIVKEEFVSPPVHQPGIYPKFLADIGVKTIIAGGMGNKAHELFAQNDIEVCVGVNTDSPKILVEQYFNNQLQTGQNQCDH